MFLPNRRVYLAVGLAVVLALWLWLLFGGTPAWAWDALWRTGGG